MAAASDTTPRMNTLDRMFLLFTDIRPGEAAGVLLLGVNIFLLLGSYYMLKTIREGLVLGQSGAEVKSYSAAAQALVLLLLLPVYGWLGSNVNRMRLITWGNMFFVACLGVFSALDGAGVRIGVPYYIWLGIYNNFVIAQFWAFANDIHSEEQGKRLFPAIGIGGTLGALIGSITVSNMLKHWGPAQVMWGAAGVLIVCTQLTYWSNRRAAGRSETQRKISGQKLSKADGFQLIRRDRYLLLIALVILLLNTVNTLGGFMLDKYVVGEAARQAGEGPGAEAKRIAIINWFYGDFNTTYNLLCFLMQTFLASRLIKYIGVRGTMFILPVVAFGGYGMFAVAPALAAVKYTKILENATDYSIMNTVKQMLWLPTSREAKYKAKSVVDTFVVRCGDMVPAAIVKLGSSLAFTLSSFALIQVALVIVWLGLSGLLARQHEKVSTIAGEVG